MKLIVTYTRSLQAQEKILYFCRHSEKKVNDELLKIRALILALLETAKIGVDLYCSVILFVAAFLYGPG
jgi:hypothetical protein